MKKKRLHIFTAYYPASRFEVYMDSEMMYVHKEFDEIFIYPRLKNQEFRKIPENCKVKYVSDYPEFHIPVFKLIFFYIDLIFKLVACEIKDQGWHRVWKNKSFLWNYLLHQLRTFHILKKELKGYRYDSFYSNWSVDSSLALAFLKEAGYIDSFVLRAHRYDLYDEEFPIGFIPFRKYQQKLVNMIASISQDGLSYLADRFPELQGKLSLHRLGTSDNGISLWKGNDIIRIVSCSNLKKVKRVHLIAEALMKSNRRIEWHHFGDGELRTEIENLTTGFPPRVSSRFHGRIPTDQLFNFYKNNFISLFINVSASEGIPVSIMEAISFGIPVVATDVGGTSEIVNEKTGKLLPEDIQADQLAEIIVSESEKWADENKREEIRRYWKENYSAEKCFPAFAIMLSESQNIS